MSIENVIAFMEAAAVNPALLVEVNEATSSGELAGTSEAIASLGKREGFDFSALEAAEACGAMLQSVSGGELDNSELDKVVGGSGSVSSLTVTPQMAQILAALKANATGVKSTASPVSTGTISAGTISAVVGAGVGAAAGGGSASQVAAATTAVDAIAGVYQTSSAVPKVILGS